MLGIRRRPVGDLTGPFNRWLVGAGILEVLFVFIAVWMFSIQFEGSERWSIIAVGGISGATAAALGGLTGFLFGVPRVLQSDLAPEKYEEARVLSNSNLEQISDWLTKVLVGVGLVQIATLPSMLNQLGTELAPAFGNKPTSSAFAVGLILCSAVVGFLVVYMWTRTTFLEYLQRFAERRREIKQGYASIRAESESDDGKGETR